MPNSDQSKTNLHAYGYEALFNHASMGIVVVDSKSLIQSVNPFALKLFGYAMDEVLGKPIEVLIPQRYHHKHVDHRNAYTNNPKSRPMGVGLDLFAVKKDGTEFPVEVSLGNYQNNGDNSVIAFISDISVRRKALEEIEKLNNELETTVAQRTQDLTTTLQQLEASNERLEDLLAFQKALLDNAGAMIIATDDKGEIQLFNREASLNLGYNTQEIIHKQNPTLFHTKTEIESKRKALDKTFDVSGLSDFEILTIQAKNNVHENEEFTFKRKDGTTFPVSMNLTVIKETNGEIAGYMGIASDISARKKAEADLLQSLKKEKELSELKSRFVSMASHEFRTPLSTVLSSAYLIEKYVSTEDQDKREKHIQRIVSSVTMLTDILNEFLSVGKIEEGKIQVRLTNFNLQETIIDIIGTIKNSLRKEQEIHYQHEGLKEVLMDANLMKYIILNLVSNASKFSAVNSPIEIKSLIKNNQVILSVKDFGIGISKEDQKHLMERFFRGANAGNIQGTGLGLHIVSKYAELMNGEVKCESELDKGTTFTITFNTKTD